MTTPLSYKGGSATLKSQNPKKKLRVYPWEWFGHPITKYIYIYILGFGPWGWPNHPMPRVTPLLSFYFFFQIYFQFNFIIF